MAPQMTPQVLADYIKSQLQRGITESQIKDYLLTEKIAQADIDEALKIVKGPSISQPQPAPLQQATPAQPSSQFGAFQQPSMVKPAMSQQPTTPRPSIMQTSDISKPNVPPQSGLKPSAPQQPAFSGTNMAQSQILNTGITAKPVNQPGSSMGMGNIPGSINIPSTENVAPKKSNKILYAILAVVLVLIIGGGIFAYFNFINTGMPVAEVTIPQAEVPIPTESLPQPATTTEIMATSTTATSSLISTSTPSKGTSTVPTAPKATSTVAVPTKPASTSTLP